MMWTDPIHKEANINNDHQRMVVDPMIMIVQSFRSFLSALTPTALIPTAVVPIADILPKFT